MRVKIVQEGVAYPNGRTFEHGSLQSRERQISVLLNGGLGDSIGFAKDFQIDADGWISYDITFDQDFLDQFIRTNDSILEWFDFSGMAHNIRQLTSGSKMLVTFGEIVAIYAIPVSGIPKALAKEIPMNDVKTAHTDRHDGGPEARAQRAIYREESTLLVLNKNNIDTIVEKTGRHPDDLLRLLSDAKREGKSVVVLTKDGLLW